MSGSIWIHTFHRFGLSAVILSVLLLVMFGSCQNTNSSLVGLDYHLDDTLWNLGDRSHWHLLV